MRPALQALLTRERAVVGGGLAVLGAIGWLVLVRLAATMPRADTAMDAMAMPHLRPWAPVDVLLLFVMWASMMVAMMVPAAAPMILTFTAVNRRRAAAGRPLVHTGAFVAAYLLVWVGYSLLATGAQSVMHAAALLSPTMATATPHVGGAVLVAAGVFQWTPLKRACLVACRSPLTFLMTRWREGGRGALRLGLQHGLYCVGCCWLLMALLFVAGVMNLAWVAAIAAFVLVERVAPWGAGVGRLGGAALVALGVTVLVRAA